MIGLDPVAAAMAKSSRCAARSVRRGGRPNALFAVATAEAPPPELPGRADLVTVILPWGSLLRGVAGLDDRVADGLVSLLRPGAVLELVLSVAERDNPPVADPVSAARTTFEARGLRAHAIETLTIADLANTGSAWAKRLASGGGAGRSAWRLRLSATIGT